MRSAPVSRANQHLNYVNIYHYLENLYPHSRGNRQLSAPSSQRIKTKNQSRTKARNLENTKVINPVSRPPVPSHSTLLMALSKIEGLVAGLAEKAFWQDLQDLQDSFFSVSCLRPGGAYGPEG